MLKRLDELQKALESVKADLKKVKPEKPEGVSDRGIEVRRADPKTKDKFLSHGYARVSTPEFHAERAKTWARQDLARLRSQPAPKLTKEEEVEKMSNYGPKRGGQYTVAHNVKRKANNTGDQTGFGQNVNTKSYSTKPGQLSGKAQAAQEQKKVKRLSGPAKIYTPEERAVFETKMGLKKQEEVVTPHGQIDTKQQLPGKAPLPVQIDEDKKKLKADGKSVELLDFNKSGQWSLKTK